MTLIEALPRSEMGDILIPVAAITEGAEISGGTSEEFLRAAFAAFVDVAVPLTAEQYQNILNISTDNWRLNWQAFRAQGII